MNSGIYKIINLLDGNLYIGSSININKRFKYHLYLLQKNKHHSKHLQNAWNKYGKNNFRFEFIENVNSEKKKLTEREQFYLDNLKPTYNTCKKAYSCLGINSGENHPRAKLNLVQVNEIRKQLLNRKQSHKTRKDIADQFGISLSTIKYIKSYYGWKDSSNYKKQFKIKLNLTIANNIRKDYLSGDYKQKELAIKYGITKQQTSYILRNEIWIDNKYIYKRK